MTTSPPIPWDDRRALHLFPSAETLIDHVAEDFARVAQECILQRGGFYVVLAGGSTPLALYKRLSSAPTAASIDWSRVHLFWGDERCVPTDSSESNYGAAMRAGFESLPIPPEQIHRMQAESHIEVHARKYDELLRRHLPHQRLDLVLLGLGEDGHTASLFPHTRALHETSALCVANWIEAKETWRMTLTYPGLALADRIWFLVTGASKADILAEVLTDLSDQYPASRIGSPSCPALFLTDQAAGHLIPIRLPS